MNYQNIQQIFNRSIALTFSKIKFLFVFCVLALCGLLVVFFRALALNAGSWVFMSLTFLPIFLCAGLLLSAGIILTRIYHNEVKKAEGGFWKVLNQSWVLMIGASYFSIPIILSYLVLWILLGLFFLLSEIPFIGPFFGVLLSFAPFLLNFASLVLCLLNLIILFVVTPALALVHSGPARISQVVIKRIKGDLFSNIVLAIISALPLFIIVGFLIAAAFMTGCLGIGLENPLQIVFQWFFIMIPFTAILTPAVIFFFNFAAESHVLLQRELKKKKG